LPLLRACSVKSDSASLFLQPHLFAFRLRNVEPIAHHVFCKTSIHLTHLLFSIHSFSAIENETEKQREELNAPVLLLLKLEANGRQDSFVNGQAILQLARACCTIPHFALPGISMAMRVA